MKQRFNIYYIGSIIVLFIMALVFFRSMRDMGISLWRAEHRPAVIWAESLCGEYMLRTGVRASPSTATLATVYIRELDSMRTGLNATRVLEYRVEPEDLSDIPPMQGYLAVSDFEDHQILVEWYDGLHDLQRMEGCEFLFEGDSSKFLGSTLGDMCYLESGRHTFAHLTCQGSRRDFRVELDLHDSASDAQLDEWAYRLVRVLVP